MRISRDQMFMGMAKIAAQRSTCHRMSVGAILVQDRNVISIGYNGSPSGEAHCEGNDCPLTSTGGCSRADHAEHNALGRLIIGRNRSEKKTLYVTHSPCIQCAELIMDCPDVTEIIFETPYRDEGPLAYLSREGLKVFRLTPSGYKIHWSTNEVVTLV